MNKYEHSNIYKIVNDVDDMVYIGSTILKLNERWRHHLYDSHRFKNGKLDHKFHELGIEHLKIILISIYPCKSKEQLLQREREEFEKHDASKLLNKFLPIISKKEQTEYRKRFYQEYKVKNKYTYKNTKKSIIQKIKNKKENMILNIIIKILIKKNNIEIQLKNIRKNIINNIGYKKNC